MKPWFKRVVWGVAGATVLAGGLSACGHHSGERGGWMASAEEQVRLQGKIVEKVGRKLDLNEAQKQQLVKLAEALQVQRAALAQGASTHPRAEVQALIAGNTLDRSRAQALVTQKTQALQAGSPAVIAAAADFFDGLNPAQQQQVRDVLQRRHGWWYRG
jgi:Spy/CpxP family protein refolding chaperone